MSTKKSPLAVDFGKRLSELIEQQGVKSQRKFAQKHGFPQQTINNFVSGACLPTLETALALARALGITLEELAGLPSPRPLPDCVMPVVGTVGASVTRTGSYGDEGETVSLAGCKGLQVHDDSMNPVARHGQVVLYNPTAPVKSGDLVVVDLDDGLIFKQYHRVDGIHQFVSLNVSLGLPPIVRKKLPGAMHKVVAVVMQ